MVLKLLFIFLPFHVSNQTNWKKYGTKGWVILDKKQQKPKMEAKQEQQKNKKDEGNNQWTSTGLRNSPDRRERRDGPGVRM
jgi:hypothetical protein